MIKTFIHKTDDVENRDKDVNAFIIENEVYATQTNNNFDIKNGDNIIITTVFYNIKQKTIQKFMR